VQTGKGRRVRCDPRTGRERREGSARLMCGALARMRVLAAKSGVPDQLPDHRTVHIRRHDVVLRDRRGSRRCRRDLPDTALRASLARACCRSDRLPGLRPTICRHLHAPFEYANGTFPLRGRVVPYKPCPALCASIRMLELRFLSRKRRPGFRLARHRPGDLEPGRSALCPVYERVSCS